MLYWSKYDDHTIIEDKSLTELARDVGVKLENYDFCKETRDWFNFARIIARKNGFNVICDTCFTYYVTLYFADEGISAGAEDEYFLKKLDSHIHGLYVKSLDKNDLDYQKVYFFNSLVSLFGSDLIHSFEKQVFRHNVRVSKDILDWFHGFGSYREAILSLLVGDGVKPHLNVYCPPVGSVVFMLTYSEEVLWRGLSSFGDRDRLRVLLY